jgi:hypothetical protein
VVVPNDVVLTRYERRSWKQLRRQLEVDRPSARRVTPWAVSGAAALMLGAGAVVGGALGALAVAVYLGIGLALWALHRALWRSAPLPPPP